MSTKAVKVEKLGKKYRIGSNGERDYRTLRDGIGQALRSGISRLRSLVGGDSGDDQSRMIWALKKISFDIEKGEVVGVIGRNGAGKSTLLKVMSRITPPTEGEIHLRGRVGSLLEVGTGFHRELTGRENIFLNGAILGMSNREIEAKFGRIVEFAGVEKFLHTPVKHYSSGMRVRLAFSVAAHLDPEILLVDEVLAVGDLEFQKKCLGKMEDISNQGRTVLFVSHNMGRIRALCDRALMLDKGKLVREGTAGEVVEDYLSSIQSASERPVGGREDREGTGEARITDVYLADPSGRTLSNPTAGQPCEVVIEYESGESFRNPTFKVTIYNSSGQPLTHLDSTLTEAEFGNVPASGRIVCRLDRLPLSQGAYHLNVSMDVRGGIVDRVEGAYQFSVARGDYYGTGRNVKGLEDVCLVDQEWDVAGSTESSEDPDSPIKASSEPARPPGSLGTR